MSKYDKLIQIIDEVEHGRDLKLIVTVVKLPTGALETAINTDNLYNKLKYILTAYNEDLFLKTNLNINIVDFIIV